MNLRQRYTFAALAALALVAPAEAAADPTFHLRAGLVTSRFTIFGSSAGFVDSGGFGSPGFAGGAGVRVPVSGRFDVQFETLYVRKAGDLQLAVQSPFRPDFFSNFYLRTSIDYLELPLTVRYEFPIDNARPYVMGGAAYAIKVGARTDAETDSALVELGIGRLDNLVNDHDVTLILGAGVEFEGSPWGLEIRASLGLSHVFRDFTPSDRAIDSSARTRAFLFLVGYRF